jgi:hypothetical protein
MGEDERRGDGAGGEDEERGEEGRQLGCKIVVKQISKGRGV